MNDQWTPCSEKLPDEGDELKPYWVAICGFTREYPDLDLKYVSWVEKGYFWADWRSPDLSREYGLRIVAWKPYVTPTPYIEPRHACKLCCGDKVLGNGKDQTTCWRCDGRGDEAADGSDAVQRLSDVNPYFTKDRVPNE